MEATAMSSMITALEAFWPILVSIFSLWVGGFAIAIGLTLWIMGQLRAQDGARTEMKEAVLLEIRQKYDNLKEHIDKQHNEIWVRINELTNRITRVEARIEKRTDA